MAVPTTYSATHSARGFTLLELLVVMAIIAIAAGIALPSFKQTMDNSNTISIANNIVGALRQAQSEAASRNLQVAVCGAAANWNAGWSVVAFTPGANSCSTGTQISQYPPPNSTYNIYAAATGGSGSGAAAVFNSLGLAQGLTYFDVNVCLPTQPTRSTWIRVGASGAVQSQPYTSTGGSNATACN